LKAVNGVVYIYACIRKIELMKELMMLEIEMGNEVLIPKVLS